MQPVFHHQRIAAYAETMVAYTARLLETWQDGEIRDIHRDMTQLTLNVVTKTLFDRDMEGTEARDVAHALDVAMEWFASQRQWGFMLPYWVPTDVNRRYARALEEMDSSIYNLIRERRAGGENTGDLLSMLLQVQDETDGSRMSDRQLRDELATMVLAGHETTSNALAWTWMLLAQHPEVEARLLEEIQAVLGDRQPTAADLPLLPYTRAVIQESMRLYPPVFMQARSAARDCEVAGYRISANSIVLVSQWVMHRSDRYFEEPEAFRPERWANDFEKTLPKGVYFPFGEGPRICIGKGFALMEAALILASIARRFQLSLVPEHPIELLPAITLRPKYGIEVTVAKR
jgi:cytochrome P450